MIAVWGCTRPSKDAAARRAGVTNLLVPRENASSIGELVFGNEPRRSGRIVLEGGTGQIGGPSLGSPPFHPRSGMTGCCTTQRSSIRTLGPRPVSQSRVPAGRSPETTLMLLYRSRAEWFVKTGSASFGNENRVCWEITQARRRNLAGWVQAAGPGFGEGFLRLIPRQPRAQKRVPRAPCCCAVLPYRAGGFLQASDIKLAIPPGGLHACMYVLAEKLRLL